MLVMNLAKLCIAIAGCTKGLLRVLLLLVRTLCVVRLWRGEASAHRSHYICSQHMCKKLGAWSHTMSRWLLSVNRLTILTRSHIDWLALMRALLHHHVSTTTRAWITTWWLRWPAVRLWHCTRVHSHLRIEWYRYSLRHGHVCPCGRLLYHYRCKVRTLRSHHLRTRELPKISGLWSIRTHNILRHRLAIGKLSMVIHRRRISHICVLHTR